MAGDSLSKYVKKPMIKAKSVSKKSGSWLSNAVKSLGFSTLDVLSDLLPSTIDVAKTTASTGRDLAQFMRQGKTKDRIVTSAIGKMYYSNLDIIREGIKNSIEDLKSGKLYNQERVDAYNKKVQEQMMDMGGDFDFGGDEDFDFGENDDFSSSVESSDGETAAVFSRKKYGDTELTQVSVDTNLGTDSALYQVAANQTETMVNVGRAVVDYANTNTRMLVNLLGSIRNEVNASLGSINENITTIATTGLESFSKTGSLAAKYFEDSIGLQTKILEAINFQGQTGPNTTRKFKDYQDVQDLFSAGGALNYKDYFGVVKNQFNKYSDENMFLSAMKQFFSQDEGFYRMMIQNPLSFIPKAITKGILPSIVKSTLSEVDNQIKETGLAFLNQIAGLQRSENPILSAVGRIFGLQNKLTVKSVDKSQFNKGKTTWMGTDHQALVNVIPTYLRKILAAVSGTEEIGYDYNQNTFSKVRDLEEKAKSDVHRMLVSGYSSEISELKQFIDEKISVNSRAEADKYKAGIETFFENLVKKNKGGINPFRFASKDSEGNIIGVAKDDIKELMETTDIDPVLNIIHGWINGQIQEGNLSKITSMLSGSTRQSAIATADRNMRSLYDIDPILSYIAQYGGDTGALGTHSIGKTGKGGGNATAHSLKTDSHLEYYDGTNEIRAVKGGIGYAEDEFGKNQLDYLRDILKTLTAGIFVVPVSGFGTPIDTTQPNIPKSPKSSKKKKGRPNRGISHRPHLPIQPISSQQTGAQGNDTQPVSTISPEEFERFKLIQSRSKKVTDTMADQVERSNNNATKYHNAAIRSLNAETVEKKEQSGEKVRADELEKVTSVGTVFASEQNAGNKIDQETFFGKLLDLLPKDSGAAKLVDRARTAGSKISAKIADIAKGVDRTLFEFIYGNPEGRKGFAALWDRAFNYIKLGFSKVGRFLDEKLLKPLDEMLFGENGLFNKFKQTEFWQNMSKFFSDMGTKVSIFLLGTKDSEGNRSGGLFSETWNSLRNIGSNVKEAILGGKGPDGKPLPLDQDTSVMGNLKRLFNNATTSIKNALGIDTTKSSESFSTKLAKGLDAVYLRIKERSKEFTTSLFGQFTGGNEFVKQFNEDLKGQKGYIGASAVLGGLGAVTLSGHMGIIGSMFLPSGLLGGAILGAGIGIATKSTAIKNFLFGPEENGERQGGLITKEFQNFFKDNKTGIAWGAGIGLASSFGLIPYMFVPGGPIGGALVGGALSLAAKSGAFSNLLYGEGGTKDNPTGGLVAKFKSFFGKDKNLKNIAIDGGIGAGVGILGSFFLPGGPILGAVLGAAGSIGLASEKFKTWFFGPATGPDGQRSGGAISRFTDYMKEHVFGPLAQATQIAQVKILGFVRDNMMIPFKYAMKPLITEARYIGGKIKDMASAVWGGVKDLFHRNVVKPIGDTLEKYFLGPMRKLFSTFFKGVGKIFGAIIASPFTLLTALAKGAYSNQKDRGKADFDEKSKAENGWFGDLWKRIFDDYHNKQRTRAQFGEKGASYDTTKGKWFEQAEAEKKAGKASDEAEIARIKSKGGSGILSRLLGFFISSKTHKPSDTTSTQAVNQSSTPTTSSSSSSSEMSMDELKERASEFRTNPDEVSDATRVDVTTAPKEEVDKYGVPISRAKAPTEDYTPSKSTNVKTEPIRTVSSSSGRSLFGGDHSDIPKVGYQPEKKSDETQAYTPVPARQTYMEKIKSYNIGDLVSKIQVDVKQIADSVYGQLNGVGSNVNKIYRVLLKKNNISDDDVKGTNNKDYMGFWGKIRTALNRPVQVAKDLITWPFKKINEGLSWTWGKVKKIGGVVSTAASAVKKGFSSLLKGLGWAVKTIGKAIVEVATEVIKFPFKLLNAGVDFIKSLAPAVGNVIGAATEVVGTIVTGIASIITDSVRTLGGVIVGVSEGFGKLVGSVFDATGKIITGTIGALTEGIKAIWGGLKAVGSVIVSPLKAIGKGLGSLFGLGVKKVYVVGGVLDRVRKVSHVFDVHLTSDTSEETKVNVPNAEGTDTQEVTESGVKTLLEQLDNEAIFDLLHEALKQENETTVQHVIVDNIVAVNNIPWLIDALKSIKPDTPTAGEGGKDIKLPKPLPIKSLPEIGGFGPVKPKTSVTGAVAIKSSKTQIDTDVLMIKIQKDVRQIADSVYGQLNGVGSNVNKIYRLLLKINNQSDDDIQGANNKQYVGFFGKLRTMFNRPFQALGDIIMSPFRTIKETINNAIEKVKDFVLTPFKAVKNFFTSILDKLPSMKTIAGFFKNSYKRTKEFLGKKWTQVTTKLGDLRKSFIENAKKSKQWIMDKLTSATEKLHKLKEDLSKKFKKAGKFIQTHIKLVGRSIKKNLKAIRQSFLDNFDAFKKKIREDFSEIGKKVKDWYKKSIKPHLDKLKTTISTQIGKIKDSIKTNWDKAKNYFVDKFKAFSKKYDIKGKVTKVITEFKKFANELLTNAWKGIKEIAKGAWSGLKWLGGKALSSSIGFVKGLFTGKPDTTSKAPIHVIVDSGTLDRVLLIDKIRELPNIGGSSEGSNGSILDTITNAVGEATEATEAITSPVSVPLPAASGGTGIKTPKPLPIKSLPSIGGKGESTDEHKITQVEIVGAKRGVFGELTSTIGGFFSGLFGRKSTDTTSKREAQVQKGSREAMVQRYAEEDKAKQEAEYKTGVLSRLSHIKEATLSHLGIFRHIFSKKGLITGALLFALPAIWRFLKGVYNFLQPGKLIENISKGLSIGFDQVGGFKGVFNNIGEKSDQVTSVVTGKTSSYKIENGNLVYDENGNPVKTETSVSRLGQFITPQKTRINTETGNFETKTEWTSASGATAKYATVKVARPIISGTMKAGSALSKFLKLAGKAIDVFVGALMKLVNKITGKAAPTTMGGILRAVSSKVLTPKVLESRIGKIVAFLARLTGQGVSAAATLMLSEAAFVIYGAISGGVNAAGLFEVPSENVDWIMRSISSVINGFLGSTYGITIDFINELTYEILGVSFVKEIATWIYGLISDESSEAALKQAQDDFNQKYIDQVMKEYDAYKAKAEAQGQKAMSLEDFKASDLVTTRQEFNSQVNPTLWGRIWNGTKNVVGSAWEGTKSLATNVATSVSDAASWTWDKLKAGGNYVAEGFKAVDDVVLPWLKAAGSTVDRYILTPISNGLKETGTLLKETGKTLVAHVSNVVGKAWDAIKTGATNIWTDIKTGALNFWNKWSGLVNGLVDDYILKPINSYIIDPIKNYWKDNVNKKDSFIYRLKVLGEIIVSIPESISNLFTRIKDFISDAWEGIKNGIKNGWNKLVDKVSSLIPDWLKPSNWTVENFTRKANEINAANQAAIYESNVTSEVYRADVRRRAKEYRETIGKGSPIESKPLAIPEKIGGFGPGDKSKEEIKPAEIFIRVKTDKDSKTVSKKINLGGDSDEILQTISLSTPLVENVRSTKVKTVEKPVEKKPEIPKETPYQSKTDMRFADASSVKEVVVPTPTAGFGGTSVNAKPVETLNGMPYYSQNDPQYKNIPYKRTGGYGIADSGTIGDSGCGPTAMAMVATKATGKAYDPVSMAHMAEGMGESTSRGTMPNYFTKAGNALGIPNAQVQPSKENLETSLASGQSVILQGAKGISGSMSNNNPYTSGGHYVVATNAGKGYVGISDPNGKGTSGYYPIDDVMSDTTGMWSFGSYAAAGGITSAKPIERTRISPVLLGGKAGETDIQGSDLDWNKWVRIVRAVKHAISLRGPILNSEVTITVGGKTVTTTANSLGYLNACLRFFGVLADNESLSFADLIEPNSNDLKNTGFYKLNMTRSNWDWGRVREGDILIHDDSVDIYASTSGSEHQVYNCGTSSSVAFQRSSKTSFESGYDIVWRNGKAGSSSIRTFTVSGNNVNNKVDTKKKKFTSIRDFLGGLADAISKPIYKALGFDVDDEEQTKIKVEPVFNGSEAAPGSTDQVQSGSVLLTGASDKERVWNYLTRDRSFKPEATAGIMSSWQALSKINPLKVEGDNFPGVDYPGAEQVFGSPKNMSDWAEKLFKIYEDRKIGINQEAYRGIGSNYFYPGIGIGQFSGPRAEALYNFKNPTTQSRMQGQDDNWDKLGTQLAFAMTSTGELHSKSSFLNKINDAKSPEEAATLSLDFYENDDSTYHTQNPEADTLRKVYAREIFDRFKGLSGNKGDITGPVTGQGDFPKYQLPFDVMEKMISSIAVTQPNLSSMMDQVSLYANIADSKDNETSVDNLVKVFDKLGAINIKLGRTVDKDRKFSISRNREDGTQEVINREVPERFIPEKPIYDATSQSKSDAKVAIEEVLTGGKRTLPRYVDTIIPRPSIISAFNEDGTELEGEDRYNVFKNYEPFKTRVQSKLNYLFNEPSSLFYKVIGPGSSSDLLTYTSPELREKYGEDHYHFQLPVGNKTTEEEVNNETQVVNLAPDTKSASTPIVPESVKSDEVSKPETSVNTTPSIEQPSEILTPSVSISEKTEVTTPVKVNNESHKPTPEKQESEWHWYNPFSWFGGKGGDKSQAKPVKELETSVKAPLEDIEEGFKSDTELLGGKGALDFLKVIAGPTISVLSETRPEFKKAKPFVDDWTNGKYDQRGGFTQVIPNLLTTFGGEKGKQVADTFTTVTVQADRQQDQFNTGFVQALPELIGTFGEDKGKQAATLYNQITPLLSKQTTVQDVRNVIPGIAKTLNLSEKNNQYINTGLNLFDTFTGNAQPQHLVVSSILPDNNVVTSSSIVPTKQPIATEAKKYRNDRMRRIDELITQLTAPKTTGDIIKTQPQVKVEPRGTVTGQPVLPSKLDTTGNIVPLQPQMTPLQQTTSLVLDAFKGDKAVDKFAPVVNDVMSGKLQQRGGLTQMIPGLLTAFGGDMGNQAADVFIKVQPIVQQNQRGNLPDILSPIISTFGGDKGKQLATAYTNTKPVFDSIKSGETKGGFIRNAPQLGKAMGVDQSTTDKISAGVQTLDVLRDKNITGIQKFIQALPLVATLFGGFGESEGTIGDSGCGPTAMAMVASKETGKSITPPMMAQMSEQMGTSTSLGTSPSYFGAAGNALGIPNIQLQPTKENLQNSLVVGDSVILQGIAGRGMGEKTSNQAGNLWEPYKEGHYVVATKADDRHVEISNPSSPESSGIYPIDSVMQGTTGMWSFGRGGFGNVYKSLGSKPITKGGKGAGDYERWISIIKAVKQAIAAQRPGYSQSNYITVTIGGRSVKTRTDCSGFVSTCLKFFGVLPEDVFLHSAGMLNSSSQMSKTGFTLMSWPGWNNLQEGDILVRNGHTEIFARNAGNSHMVYNCGSSNSVNNPNATYTAHKEGYTVIWRLGGASAGANAISSFNVTGTPVDNGTTVTGSTTSSSMSTGVGDLLSGFADAITRPILEQLGLSSPSSVDSGGVDTGGVAGPSNDSSISPATNITSGNVPKQVWDFFTSHGYSKQATAGILGNMQVESGVNPNVIQSNGKGPAAGIVQWENINKRAGRWKSMADYAASKGKQWTDLTSQLEFVDKELRGLGKFWSYQPNMTKAGTVATSFGQWSQSGDVGTATRQFEGAFERAGIPHMERRIAAAKGFYDKFTSGKGGAVIEPKPLIKSISSEPDSLITKQNVQRPHVVKPVSESLEERVKTGLGGYGMGNVMSVPYSMQSMIPQDVMSTIQTISMNQSNSGDISQLIKLAIDCLSKIADNTGATSQGIDILNAKDFGGNTINQTNNNTTNNMADNRTAITTTQNSEENQQRKMADRSDYGMFKQVVSGFLR